MMSSRHLKRYIRRDVKHQLGRSNNDRHVRLTKDHTGPVFRGKIRHRTYEIETTL